MKFEIANTATSSKTILNMLILSNSISFFYLYFCHVCCFCIKHFMFCFCYNLSLCSIQAASATWGLEIKWFVAFKFELI